MVRTLKPFDRLPHHLLSEIRNMTEGDTKNVLRNFEMKRVDQSESNCDYILESMARLKEYLAIGSPEEKIVTMETLTIIAEFMSRDNAESNIKLSAMMVAYTLGHHWTKIELLFRENGYHQDG